MRETKQVSRYGRNGRKIVFFGETVMLLHKPLRPGLTIAVFAWFIAVAGWSVPVKEWCFSEGFEHGLDQWTLSVKDARKVTLDRSKSPERGQTLHLRSPLTLESKAIKVKAGARYCFEMESWSEKCGHFSVYIKAYDALGKQLTYSPDKEILQIVSGTWEGKWEAGRQKRQFWFRLNVPFDTPVSCAYVKIFIFKMWDTGVWIDNLEIRPVGAREILRAEPLLPSDHQRFDSHSLALPGPDGFLYPNWIWAGAIFFKPQRQEVFHVNDFGAVPDDGKDDTIAIEAACENACRNGGGTVRFGAGTYRLTRKIMISTDNVILRGAGSHQTKIVFNLPDSQVIVLPVGNLSVHSGSVIEIFFKAAGVKSVTVCRDGEVVGQYSEPSLFQSLPEVPEFRKISVPMKEMLKNAKAGKHIIKALVTYADGREKEAESIVYYRAEELHAGAYNHSVISFVGRICRRKNRTEILNELHRGDRIVETGNAARFKPGDYICLDMPDSTRWNKLAHNTCTAWGMFRRFVTVVEKVRGNQITLMQPVRIDYPLADKPYVNQFLPVKNCAIENMSIAQEGVIQKELKMGAVLFHGAANCRAEDLVIDRPGTQGVWGLFVKFCEVRNCVFRNPWWTNHGGLAYTGWDLAWDCLIEKVETFRMRHAPLLNWSSSGNVIRDSVFHESDAQWHSGWCRDNLCEQCTVDSTTLRYCGYGYGFYSTPTDDSQHGPNGPRNVVYNCRGTSLKAAFYLGGMNQQWMLMYNTLKADEGPGIISRLGCRDNIIKGNVFVLATGFPMMYYEFIDNTGDKVIDNTVYGGNGKLFAGPGQPEIRKNNRFLPITAHVVPARAPVPSIYLWQKKHYSLPSAGIAGYADGK